MCVCVVLLLYVGQIVDSCIKTHTHTHTRTHAMTHTHTHALARAHAYTSLTFYYFRFYSAIVIHPVNRTFENIYM